MMSITNNVDIETALCLHAASGSSKGCGGHISGELTINQGNYFVIVVTPWLCSQLRTKLKIIRIISPQGVHRSCMPDYIWVDPGSCARQHREYTRPHKEQHEL